MARRLLIAFVLTLLVSAACWLLLPRAGLGVPWFVPLLGFVVIVIGVLVRAASEPPRQREQSREERFLTPDPGPSPEDIQRFGDPGLRLTDRED